MTEINPEFVYLNDIAPSIIQDIRYYSDNNFVGSRIDGYKANCAMMAHQTALLLRSVQEDFASLGFSLVIYEGYRPQKATEHFLKWSQDPLDSKMRSLYYPRVNKSDLFNAGYIAKRSSHTRGAAVDVSLIQLNKKLHSPISRKRKLNDGTELTYLDDGSQDMGSHFDLLDEASWHDSNLVTQEQSQMRNLLRSQMQKHGFKMYQKEWWHYSLKNEPFPETYFDFDIAPSTKNKFLLYSN